jgi:hypothetical protein
MATKRKLVYDRSLNVKMTEDQYKQMMQIKAITGISLSKLMRENLTFLVAYHLK